MTLSKEAARQLLRDHKLRATAPRLAVIRLLASQSNPLSHKEVLNLLGNTDWDQATVYRNLIKLTEAGLTRVVSRAKGMACYRGGGHQHPCRTRHGTPPPQWIRPGWQAEPTAQPGLTTPWAHCRS